MQGPTCLKPRQSVRPSKIILRACNQVADREIGQDPRVKVHKIAPVCADLGYVRKAKKGNYENLSDRLENDPFFMFNCAQSQLTPLCLRFIERLARPDKARRSKLESFSFLSPTGSWIMRSMSHMKQALHTMAASSV